jgi:hypothetical protein
VRSDSIRRNDNFPVLVSLAVALGILVGAFAVVSMQSFVDGNKETMASVGSPLGS